ncbi:MAG: hypothetical protein KDI65_10600 [Alphaproteobacteria bacterium]|nr:hypothetical protein [Alphaproteobacteria bacterium]
MENTQTTHQTNTTQQEQEPDVNRPEDVLRDGNLKATVWKNEGENGDYYSTTLSRTWQDEDGNYRDSHSFSGAELLRVSELARGAYARTNELRQEQQQEQAQDKQQGRTSSGNRQQDMDLEDGAGVQDQSREDFKASRGPRSRRSRQNVQR